MHLLLPFPASLDGYLKDKSKKMAEKRQIKLFLAFFFAWNCSSNFKKLVNYKKSVGTVELHMVSPFLASLIKYLTFKN